MSCIRCDRRGKTWDGDDPQCAFEAGFAFDRGDNYQCATLLELRQVAEDRGLIQYNGDQRLAVFPMDDGSFVILGWYKDRGRTEVGIHIDGDRTERLKAEVAEAALV